MPKIPPDKANAARINLSKVPVFMRPGNAVREIGDNICACKI